MNYRQIIKKLEGRGSLPGLGPVRALLGELGNPQDKVKTIHVAGTNGKGSVCAFLDSILREAGFRSGRFLSPAVLAYEEKFQINGCFIKPEVLEELLGRVLAADQSCVDRGNRPCTLFELETAIAFCWFDQCHVDLALVECGMGGLLDATNVIASPLLSVITSISHDHMQFLGGSLSEIAAHKAGIIKEGSPVLLEENTPEIAEVVEKTAAGRSAPFRMISPEDYRVLEERCDGNVFEYHGKRYEITLPGRHQVSNAVTALAAVESIFGDEKNGDGRVQDGKSGNRFVYDSHQFKSGYLEACIFRGLKKARWPGRLEIIGRNPLTYRDGAHNTGGAAALASFAEKHFTNNRIIYIMGILSDKEAEKMTGLLLPSADSFYVFTPPGTRALPGRDLAGIIRKQGGEARIFPRVTDALGQARADAGPEDILIVCGSLSFMEEMEYKNC